MKYVINSTICNLRKEPNSHSELYIKDLSQESQLLFGEKVLVKKMEGDWTYIEALEQKKYCKDRGWINYPGWIPANQLLPVKEEFPEYNLVVTEPHAKLQTMKLSFGTYLLGKQKNAQFWTLHLPDHSSADIESSQVTEFLPQTHLSAAHRQEIMQRGFFFIDYPYLWGGRSSLLNLSQVTSVDCSGLTNLLYRSVGIEIPRDAHDQKMKCREIEFSDLQTADFIFTAPVEKPERISHVMLYHQEDRMLEATLDVGYTRLISGKEKLGKSLMEIKSGEQVGKFIVWFGTLDHSFGV